MVKIIAIGDQHFKTDNIPEIDIFIDKIKSIIIAKEPDFVVLLGDLLHTHEKLHTVPYNKALYFINMIRKHVLTFVLVGNHDYQNNQQFLTTNHWLNAMKEWDNVVIVDKFMKHQTTNDKFVFLPYVQPSRFEEALNSGNEPWMDSSIIFCHQEFYGCSMGGFLSVEGDKWDLTFPQIISGHIHQKQKLQENIYYTGSSMEVAYGENDFNIIAYIECENKKLNVEEIDLHLRKKKLIYATLEEIETMDIPQTEDKIKISISGEYEDFKIFKKSKKYTELVESEIKVVFKPKRNEIKLKNETFNQIRENASLNDFNNILHTIILEKKDPVLSEIYEFVVNNKKINSEDILIL
jgi:DNA repair exonuclease SbcCD nuclease subunit